MSKEDWGIDINAKVDEFLSGEKEKDLRFFRVAELKRNISRVSEFSDSCGYCNQQKVDIKITVESIKEAIEVPGAKRKNYDRLISRLSSHMR